MLYFVVFAANAAILVLEIAGARQLAPFLGTSVEVWAGTIAVILAAMAVGYEFGGILADKKPESDLLAPALLCASSAAFLAWGMRDLIPSFFTSDSLHPLTGRAMLVAALLFAPTVMFLAAISPLAVKIALKDLGRSASVVGRLNALGAVGSIAGAILSSTVLIPFLGLGRIFLFTACLLLASALLVGGKNRWKSAVPAVVVACGSGMLGGIQTLDGRIIADVSTAYNRIWVEDRTLDGREIRIVQTDPLSVQCGMFLHASGSPDENAILFSYIKAVDSLIELRAPPEATALFLGGCNGSYPRTFVKERPARRASVVEIDPGMTQVARTYFGLDDAEDPSLKIIHADARVFLSNDRQLYDIVFMDAFGSALHVPHHLATAETFGELRERTRELLIMNIFASQEGDGSRIAASLLKTARTAFPNAVLYQIGNTAPAKAQNILLVADPRGGTLPEEIVHERHPEIRLMRLDERRLAEGMILTDDYAPVEYLTASLR